MIIALLLACQSDVPETPPVCAVGSAWSGSEVVFEDRSEAWGLDEIGPVGVRLSAVDFDGDGWIDLAVRSGNSRDDFAAGTRSAWLLRNTGDGRFEDVTVASGIRQLRGSDDTDTGRPGAVWVWADVDNDGDLDVYTGLPDPDADESEHSEILLNQGDGTFELAEEISGWRSSDDAPYGAAFSDVDRDGRVDLWLGQYRGTGGVVQSDELWLGDGSGGFEKQSRRLGIKTEDWVDVETLNEARAHTLAWSAAACDLNGDGWPELLASSYGRSPNHLWLNDGGSFTNWSVESGYAFDHRTDWTTNENARCFCTLQPSAEDCEGVPAPELMGCAAGQELRWSHDADREPYRLGGNSGATVCRDVDNDGWPDLLTTEIVHWDVGDSSDPSELLFNTGGEAPHFERPGNEVTGLTRTHDIDGWNDGDITGSILDFDNDGWPDVYIGSSDYPSARGWLWHQSDPRSFERVPKGQGVDHLRSHGSVVADFDRDGDLDLVVGHSTARCDDDCYSPAVPRLLENLTNDEGQSNWVSLKLIASPATGANAAAIGARVRVVADGLTQTQEVVGGHGQWGSQDPLELHFGLGASCGAEVEVRWPDAGGTTEAFVVPGSGRYVLTRGAPSALPAPVE